MQLRLISCEIHANILCVSATPKAISRVLLDDAISERFLDQTHTRRQKGKLCPSRQHQPLAKLTVCTVLSEWAAELTNEVG
jgi:hypothetical protein